MPRDPRSGFQVLEAEAPTLPSRAIVQRHAAGVIACGESASHARQTRDV